MKHQHKPGYIIVVTLAAIVLLATVVLNFLPAVFTGKLQKGDKESLRNCIGLGYIFSLSI